MELASCHPSGTYNFEVVPTFLENLCTPELYNVYYICMFLFSKSKYKHNRTSHLKKLYNMFPYSFTFL
jgi:hypothetical protein